MSVAAADERTASTTTATTTTTGTERTAGAAAPQSPPRQHSFSATTESIDNEAATRPSSFASIGSLSPLSACDREKDVDFHRCWVEQLERPALQSICDRVGVDIVSDVLPYLKLKDGQPRHGDYVTAAYECLMTELDLAAMMEHNDYPDDLLADKTGLSLVLEESVARNPPLLERLEESLREEQPDLWEAVYNALEGGSIDARSLSSLIMR